MAFQRNSYWPKAATVLFILMLLIMPLIAFANPAGSPSNKIEGQLLEQLQIKDEATFWVILHEQADLSPAYAIQDWEARGRFVMEQLQETASRSQAGLQNQLQSRNLDYRPFWIVNSARITADLATVQALAALPEVKQILADRVYEIPEPTPGKIENSINAVEWGIDRINAPQVWSTFNVRGEGIVVGSIDTGAQFDHPALVTQYRGNLGGGAFDHNYNWFDPSNVCGNPSLIPCDNNGHGTHVTGTMIGDDDGSNQIGVAPGARWIAAKGCETTSCSTFALLASGQWIVAPTDLNGQSPRPDLRPHVINNSWGGGATSDPWYQGIVQAWVAAGIFPQFANGNAGPSCSSAGNPGNLPESYAAGAFDINNNIAGFSSRGPSAFGGIIKPNIAAPGVAIRSSVPGNGYASFNGTSMASPHVSGAVALMWSAAPALIGDIAQTRALLDTTAIDTSNLTCGGTPENNNVWGEGRLDAFAAVSESPMGPTGSLEGAVTDAASGEPIAAATVLAAGEINRTTTTDANGYYTFPTLSVGSYDVTVSKFGYVSQTVTDVAIAEDETTLLDFVLEAAPAGSLSGIVRDNFAQPVPNATITILGTPLPTATTDADGFYTFAAVPEGTYDVRAEAGRCNNPHTQTVMIVGATTADFSLPLRMDDFGYFCQVMPPNYVEGDTALPLTGDDSFLLVPLPFSFPFYGETYSSAFVCTNGYLNFLAGNCSFSNTAIPSAAAPNGAIYPYWDDLFVDAGIASMWTKLSGETPDRSFLIEWRNVRYFGDTTRRIDVSVTLHENGQIETQFRNIADDGRERGDSATLGIENQTGTIAFQYSFNEAVLPPGEFAIMYRLPPSGFVEGSVTDYNDGLPIAGAVVTALFDGSVVRQTSSDANGFYRMQLPLGSYTIEASMANYQSEAATITLEEDGQTVTEDFALMTARVAVTPTALQLVVPPGQSRTRFLTLSNSGSLNATWELNESGGAPVTTSSTQLLEKNPAYDPNAFTTEELYTEPTPAGWSPTVPGDVIRSWLPAGLDLAWGVGYDGNVWLSDVPANNRNHEFTPLGAATGRNWHAPWAGVWPGDMAAMGAEMCQVNVGGDNGIYCWSRETGAVTRAITGSFPWTTISQRGLAYRPDTDSFYIGGWNQGILYHVRGFSHATPGQVINQCNPPDGNISGLAWNPAVGHVWAATNSPSDTIYRLDPDSCAVISTLPHPSPGFQGGGLAMDAAGDLWMISQSPNRVYLIESGVPAFADVPWLDATPTSGTIPPAGSQQVAVTVNTSGLAPGVYAATLHFSTNSGRQPNLQVPVMLIVPGYQALVNAGGTAYVDQEDDTWAADQAYTAGSWGYVSSSSRPGSTKKNIAGTNDQPLYRTIRQAPGEYRFDGLPDGIYEVRLRFAEISNSKPGTRVFDVIVEGHFLLPAYDIAASVGSFAADEHVFYVTVTDGQLNIVIADRRGYQPPIVNALGVTHRPDQ
jgi:subtilisin family serine protease